MRASLCACEYGVPREKERTYSDRVWVNKDINWLARANGSEHAYVCMCAGDVGTNGLALSAVGGFERRVVVVVVGE